MKGAACGAENAYSSGAPDFTSGFHKGSCCPVICNSLSAEGIYSKLATHVPYEVPKRHFELLLKNCWRDLLQTCHKCSLWGPDQVLLLFKSIRNPLRPPWPLIGWHILNFFTRTADEIYSKLATQCSLWGLDQVLLLLKPIWNPTWLSWTLIGWHIFNFWRRMAAGIYSKLATHVPYEDRTKCCYFLSRSESSVAALLLNVWHTRSW